MKKSKILIAGMAAFTMFSMSAYASEASVQDQVTEIKEIIPNILKTYEITYKPLEGKKHVYKVDASVSNEFEFKVRKKDSRLEYEFKDRGSDGTLDVYVGTKGFEFTPENTPAENWKKLEEKFCKYVGEILPLAKKILEEKDSSLDIDLEEM